jgi:hypothetical protein
MLPGNVSLRSRPRRVGNSVVSSWTRTLAVAAVLLLAFIVLAALALTGRLGDLRYANIPLVHPYPPPGYYLNPFNPGDRGDLVDAAQAGRVRADLLRDGQFELVASASGDVSNLESADTGNRLVKVREVIAQDLARGQVVKVTTHLDSLTVGRLQDPADPSVSWCVREVGTSVLTYESKTSGQVLQTQSIRFDGKYWLVLTGGRYLITDAQISNQPDRSG